MCQLRSVAIKSILSVALTCLLTVKQSELCQNSKREDDCMIVITKKKCLAYVILKIRGCELRALDIIILYVTK